MPDDFEPIVAHRFTVCARAVAQTGFSATDRLRPSGVSGAVAESAGPSRNRRGRCGVRGPVRWTEGSVRLRGIVG